MKKKTQNRLISAARKIPASILNRMVKKDADEGDRFSAATIRFAELCEKKRKGKLTLEENAEFIKARKWADAVLRQQGLK